jgi:hypothetical protein
MSIFVVCGESGEYSDWAHWTLKAFRTEAAARAYADCLDAYVAAQPRWSGLDRPFGMRVTIPLDPGMTAYWEVEDTTQPTYDARRQEWWRDRDAYFTANPYDAKMSHDAAYSVEQVEWGDA